MIHGHKPNGYYVTATGEGHKIEGETRQCVHCQYTWQYRPGSGITRGYCLSCDGFMCGRDECLLEQKKLTEMFLHNTGKVRNCMPWEEWQGRIQEKIAKMLPLEPGLTVTESGLVIPRKD